MKQKAIPIEQNKMTEIYYEDELSRIAEGTGIIFVGRFLGYAIQYLYAITIARMLGGKSFGLFMLGLTILNLAGVISRLGLDAGIIRYVSLYNGIGDKGKVKGVVVQSLKYSFIISILIGIALFLTAKPLFAKILNKPELEEIIKLLSISLPFFSLMTLALVTTRGFQIMKYTVYGQHLFWPISNLTLAVIFFFIGFGLYGVVAAHIISIFFASVLSIYFLIKTFPTIRHTSAVLETRNLLRFSIPLLLAVLLNFLIMSTDTLMLGCFRTSKEVGIYNAAIRTAFLTSMVLISFHSIFGPMISDLYHKKEIQKLRGLLKTTTKWIYMMSFPVFLSIVLLSKEIMSVFGQEFVMGWAPLIILAFAQLINASVGTVGWVLVMSGKQDIVMYNTIGICLLNIVLNYLLIPRYGILGASIASGISLIIFNTTMLLEVCYLLKMHPYSLKFLKATISGGVTYGILFLTKQQFADWSNMQKLLVCILLFTAVYSVIVLSLGLDDEDRFILGTVRARLRNVVTRKIPLFSRRKR